jgi:hypothetical protein
VEILLGVAAVLLAAATCAGTLLVFPAFWQGFRRQWERSSAEARRRGAVAAALTAVYIVAAATVAIAEPWGPESVLYVIGAGGGALMLVVLAGVLTQAVTETRRARHR